MENKRSSTVRNTMSRRRRRSMVTVGVIVVLLAVVGAFTIISMCFNLTGIVLDNTTQKRKLEHFIQPVIMFDPLTFESPETADPQFLLRSSVWSALLSKGRDNLVTDDYGSVLLPKSDVDVQAAKLYGTNVKLQHQTFGNEYEMNYYIYNAEKEVYEIQLNAEMSVYTAKILAISHKGDLYTLEVGYIPPGNLWNTDAEGNVYEPDPDKVMLLELRKVKDGYIILSLKDGPDTQAEAGAQQNAQQTPPPQDMEDLTSAMASASMDENAPSTDGTPPPVFGFPTASSFAEQQGEATFGAENAVDGKLETAWRSANGAGEDEWLMFQASTDQFVSGIQIANGRNESEELYTQNGRVTKVLLTFADGTSREEELTGGAFDKRCVIEFDEPIETSSVRITIVETEAGTQSSNAFISEVSFF